jgi:type II secretory pathway pseudopilin PulG
MRIRKVKHRGGFTLVEALAVMALIGAVLPVVMGAIGTATAAASFVHQRAIASELAANKLAEMVIGNQWQVGPTSGDVVQDALTYHWSATVQEWTASNTSVSNVMQVTLQVTWTGRGHPRSVSLTTVVYQGGNQNGASSS